MWRRLSDGGSPTCRPDGKGTMGWCHGFKLHFICNDRGEIIMFCLTGANVVMKGSTAQTDSLGSITVSDSCKTLVFSHVNYESRLINLEEVRDTVYLISKLLNLKEVVVFGHAKRDDRLDNLKNHLRLSTTDAQLIGANPNSGVNLLGPRWLCEK